MTKLEVVLKYEEEIKKAIRQAVKDTVGNPHLTEQVWIWEDGEIEYLMSGTGWLQPKQWETREIYRLVTITGADVSEYAFCEGRPDDEEECERLMEDACAHYLEEYDEDEQYDFLLDFAEAEDRLRKEEEAEWDFYYDSDEHDWEDD